MANYSITYSCGHQTDKQLYGKESERQRYIAWAGNAGVCEACRNNDAIAAAEAVEIEYDLPSLIGSDKQVAWARKIRATKVTEIVTFVEAQRTKMPADKLEQFDAHRTIVMQVLYGKSRAGWWIDNRDGSAPTLAQAAYKESRR